MSALVRYVLGIPSIIVSISFADDDMAEKLEISLVSCTAMHSDLSTTRFLDN
jgi:hypothetical protein